MGHRFPLTRPKVLTNPVRPPLPPTRAGQDQPLPLDGYGGGNGQFPMISPVPSRSRTNWRIRLRKSSKSDRKSGRSDIGAADGFSMRPCNRQRYTKACDAEILSPASTSPSEHGHGPLRVRPPLARRHPPSGGCTYAADLILIWGLCERSQPCR